jgi:tetratricopeptide (TPR) repeat protein
MPIPDRVAKEGEVVLYKCWTAVAIVAVTGCAMPDMPGLPLRWSQKPKTSQMAATQAPPVKREPGFAEQAATYLHLPGSKPKRPDPEVMQAAKQRNDPISLGFASGPPTPELYLSMAVMSDQSGNIEHARSMYQRVLSMQPNHLDAMLGLARLEDREGHMDAALRIYQQAVAIHPQSAKALNDLALCHARNGQLDRSRQLLEQAVRLQPEKALYRNNIAKVLIEMNRVDEALAHLAVVHPPAVAQYNMGVLLNDRGQKQEAIQFLMAATHIDPQWQDARKLLADLQGDQPAYAANDGVLPTPMARENYVLGTLPQSSYPSTGYVAQRPLPQSFPAETSQVPLGNAPVTLPPVR